MENFVVIGDTHGNFNYIMNYINNFDIMNTTFFHVGDFGVGFVGYHTDKANLNKLNTLLENRGCQMYVIRGNHDNPAYFDGTWDWGNLHLVPDYTVVNVHGFDVLMVGGAVSIDRKQRLAEMQIYKRNNRDVELYWFDEKFVLDEDKLKDIKGVTYVITHTCPHFVKPINNIGIPSHGYLVESFSSDDKTLKKELDEERQDMAKMYEILKKNNVIRKWFYGHFHNSNAMYYEDTDFIMLGINEFKEIKINT